MSDGSRPGVPELWGGVECTRNRVGDRFLDQLDRNGHRAREADLERFAALGIRAIRYPVLWEHVAPDGLDRADWSWTDARLARLRELGVRPIAGLVHHGSGPRHTSLVDPAFAPGGKMAVSFAAGSWANALVLRNSSGMTMDVAIRVQWVIWIPRAVEKSEVVGLL